MDFVLHPKKKKMVFICILIWKCESFADLCTICCNLATECVEFWPNAVVFRYEICLKALLWMNELFPGFE